MSAPLPRQSKSGANGQMEIESTLLLEPDSSSADSLVSSNDPDDMANEQTWPTEDEMRNGDIQEDAGSLPDATVETTPKVVKRVPKGMSEYQAAWIVDESDDDVDNAEDAGSEVDMKDQEEIEMEEEPVAEQEEEAEMEMWSRKSVTFQDFDMEEETKQ
jgi:pre-rRNA-processing protein TSR1